jgi:hypothetical protein
MGVLTCCVLLPTCLPAAAPVDVQVALDYNAGVTGALAGLLTLASPDAARH